MTTKEKKSLSGLGKLSKTFGTKTEKENSNSVSVVTHVSIDKIKEDVNNVRKKYNDSSLQEFAEVIRVVGISSAIVVRTDPDNPEEYIISNGHRRFRAAQIAGLKEVPITVNNNFNLLLQLSDNLVSEDLDLLDTADAIHTIVTSDDPLVKRTREEVAKGISKSPTWVSKILKIRTMPESIKFYYDLGRITDLDAIYQLVVNYSKYASEITKWLEKYKESSDLILQGAVNSFIKELKKPDTPKKDIQESTNGKNVDDSYSESIDDDKGGISPECFNENLTPVKDSVSFDKNANEFSNTFEALTDEEVKSPPEKSDDNIKVINENNENLTLPVMAESDSLNGIDPSTPFATKETTLSFSCDIKGKDLEESVSISKEIEKYITENFGDKVCLKIEN